MQTISRLYGELVEGDTVVWVDTAYVVESVTYRPEHNYVEIVWADTNEGQPYSYFANDVAPRVIPAGRISDKLAGLIASAILEGADDTDLTTPGQAFDQLEALEELQRVLAPAAFEQVAQAMEVCPVHLCDAQICADDEAACDAGRGI